MQINHCYVPANVSVISIDTALGETYFFNAPTTDFFSDQQYTYDNISVNNSPLSDYVCGPVLTSFSPASVVGGAADYPPKPNNKSQLTINGSGFGPNIG